MNEHLAVVQAYLVLSQALEINPAAYSAVFHPDIEQIEYPNGLTETTQHRTMEAIIDNVRAGRELLLNPQFDQTLVHNGTDGSLILEAHWQATIMHDFGPLLRGKRIEAQMCMIFEFEQGLIRRQRVYRCYEFAAA